MLLDFRIENFRSFKSESVFSLMASSDKSLSHNISESGIAQLPPVVRSAVIYGPNASGKSNLIRALFLMRGIVVESATLPPQTLLNIQPFLLDPATKDQPCIFEATISISGVRFQYGFEATPTRINAEWLLAYQTPKAAVWFDRRWNQEKQLDEYKFGSGLKGAKHVWREATRPNALFLSTAVQLNSEALIPIYRWFADELHVLPSGGHLNDFYTTDKIHNNRDWQRRIVHFLSSADITIDNIDVYEKEAFQKTFQINADGITSDGLAERSKVLRPRFIHRIGKIKATMEIEDESEGTQKLFSLAGPLFDVIQRGHVLVIDELDRSLHELLVRHFVRLFHDPEINKNGAQLIFTSHDSSLLDGNLLRRDQIWFIEKGNDSASQLVPLTDYSPRKGEAIDRGYRTGRYGAIPILPPNLKVEL